MDPFGTKHNIDINVLIKKNDGYSVNLNIIPESRIILLFDILYPDKLLPESIELIKQIPF